MRGAEQLIKRLRHRLGPPFTASHLTAALRDAAIHATRLNLYELRLSLLVLNMLSGEQRLRCHGPVETVEELSDLFVSRIPKQIYVNGAQAMALAFVAEDLGLAFSWVDCAELLVPGCADDQLLEWCGPDIDGYIYVFAADSTGRAVLARAPVVGLLTGTFRVQSDPERLAPIMPRAVTEALQMSAMYCWPG